MNIEAAVMSVQYGEARKQFDAYRALVKETPKRATKDDVTLYRALWQLKRGEKVIDIQKAVLGGGLNNEGLPNLAVGRADWMFVQCWCDDGQYVFSKRTRPWSWRGRQLRPASEIRLSLGVPSQGLGHVPSRQALTPMIPAQHRPKAALSNYHIIWEAEWQKVPPVDPILLKHIDGPFYVVLAAWDLTPLEQAVMRQRL